MVVVWTNVCVVCTVHRHYDNAPVGVLKYSKCRSIENSFCPLTGMKPLFKMLFNAGDHINFCRAIVIESVCGRVCGDCEWWWI